MPLFDLTQDTDGSFTLPRRRPGMTPPFLPGGSAPQGPPPSLAGQVPGLRQTPPPDPPDTPEGAVTGGNGPEPNLRLLTAGRSGQQAGPPPDPVISNEPLARSGPEPLPVTALQRMGSTPDSSTLPTPSLRSGSLPGMGVRSGPPDPQFDTPQPQMGRTSGPPSFPPSVGGPSMSPSIDGLRKMTRLPEQQGPPPDPTFSSPSLRAMQQVAAPANPHENENIFQTIGHVIGINDRALHPKATVKEAARQNEIADLGNRIKFEEADLRNQATREGLLSAAENRRSLADNRAERTRLQAQRDAQAAADKEATRLQGGDRLIEKYQKDRHAQVVPQTESVSFPVPTGKAAPPPVPDGFIGPVAGIPGAATAEQSFTPKVPMLAHHQEMIIDGSQGPQRLGVPDSIGELQYKRDQRLSPDLMRQFPTLDPNAFYTKPELDSLVKASAEQGRNQRQTNAITSREQMFGQREGRLGSQFTQHEAGVQSRADGKNGGEGGRPAPAGVFVSIERKKQSDLARAEADAAKRLKGDPRAGRLPEDPAVVLADLNRRKSQAQQNYEASIAAATRGRASKQPGPPPPPAEPAAVTTPAGNAVPIGKVIQKDGKRYKLIGVHDDGSPKVQEF